MNRVDGYLATILVVDDETPIRNALKRYLQVKEHEVFEACDGLEALDVMSAHGVDLAIVDLMMPRMTGIELINSMRSRFPGTRVVVISAYPDVEDIPASESGVVAVLKKPFELHQLAGAVELALRAGRDTTQH